MTLPTPSSSTLSDLLCVLGKTLVILLLNLAQLVAVLFGLPTTGIQAAITQINTANCM
ncbi:hypothetical protein [Bacillus rhizoplanae]|uniref:hypothetical protein n=1 Tax=Bacillus rhizoplanae TaxID=2880966 RepID=UPI003D1F0F1D